MKQAIIDNRSSDVPGEVLKDYMECGSLSLISAYVKVFAYEEFSKELHGLEEVKTINSERIFSEDSKVKPHVNSPRQVQRDSYEYGLKNRSGMRSSPVTNRTDL